LPLWTEVVQALGSAAALLVAIFGFGLLIHQIRQLERAIRGDTHAQLYEKAFQIMTLLAAHPDLRPYFYGNKVLRGKDPKQNEVMCAAEIVANFMEFVALQRQNLPKSVWERWATYIKDRYHTSKVLRDYFVVNRNWYADEILGLLG
jgi:hypothetical protein